MKPLPLVMLVLAALLVSVLESPAPAYTSDNLQVRTIEFPSGLRAVLVRTPAVPEREARAYVGIYTSYGSMDETALGEAHLIEHVVANSPPTAEIPAFPEQAKSFASNAATKPNYSSFFLTVSPEGLESAIYSRLTRIGRIVEQPEILKREKERVVQELKRGRRSATYSAYKALEALAKGEAPALDAEIAAVQAAEPNRIFSLIRSAYRPSRSVLVIAGDIDLDGTATLIRRAADELELDELVASADSALLEHVPSFRAEPLVLRQNLPEAFSVAIGFPRPTFASGDLIAFMVLDQLLLGGRDPFSSPPNIARSDGSPLASRLGGSLQGSGFWDGKERRWGVPLFAEGDPSLYTIVFSSRVALSPDEVLKALRRSLLDVRRQSMSDAEIEAAKRHFATFYRAWLLEPDLRIVSDHLAALALLGNDPAELNGLLDRIMAVEPDEVRGVMDEHLISATPLVAILVPGE